jgi:thioredoxin 2
MADSIVTCPHCGKQNRLQPGGDGVPRCANCHNHLPWLVSADAATFDEAIAASVPVVVDFWAEWCGPCKMISPSLEEAARSHAGRLKVVKLDVDEAPEIAGRYDVQGIPLLVVFRDGKEADRLVGAVPAAQIEAFLAPHLEAAAAQTNVSST